MRPVGFSVLLGLMLVLLGPSRGISQFPGGSGGSGRGLFGDPAAFFDKMSGGKDVVTKDTLANPFFAKIFDGLAEKMGVTNGVITRDQYLAFVQQQGAGAKTGGAPGATPGAAPDGGPGRGGFRGGMGGGAAELEAMAESWFRRLDSRGAGVLTYDEMPDNLKLEREKWDTNHDGVIDLNEFKDWVKAVFAQRMSNSGSGTGNTVVIKSGDHHDDEEDEPKPTVFRAGKLPPGLPAWFKQIDTDGDGQITMAEWRAAGKSIDEFQKIDRNGDGFLTIAEVMYYVQGKNYLNGVAVNTPSATPTDKGTAASEAGNGGKGFGKGGWGDMAKGMSGGSDKGDPRSSGGAPSDFSKMGRGGNSDGKSKGSFNRPGSGPSK